MACSVCLRAYCVSIWERVVVTHRRHPCVGPVRCNDADVRALSYFVSQIPSTDSDANLSPGFSLVVEWAIDWTENFIGTASLSLGSCSGDACAMTPAAVCERLVGADGFTGVSYKTFAWFCSGWQSVVTGQGGPQFLHPPDAFTGK